MLFINNRRDDDDNDNDDGHDGEFKDLDGNTKLY